MRRKKLTTILWLVLWLIAIIIIIAINYYNRHLIITNYKINDPRWPVTLNGWRLVQLSDIHNQATEGPGNEKIISSVQKLQPNIITITGDLFDGDRTNIPNNQTAALSGTVMRDISGQNHGTLSPPDLLFGQGF